eukprot:comp21506_c0_seq5/m.46917 comp21506_c0_seq5/g.46917  ORF comp21506_c0_seq5/g.46917 comp21506_c0_seq5/m.46917 type:complete len:318 (-) comp21506_c0_seq5:685-1638(-)
MERRITLRQIRIAAGRRVPIGAQRVRAARSPRTVIRETTSCATQAPNAALAQTVPSLSFFLPPHSPLFSLRRTKEHALTSFLKQKHQASRTQEKPTLTVEAARVFARIDVRLARVASPTRTAPLDFCVRLACVTPAPTSPRTAMRQTLTAAVPRPIVPIVAHSAKPVMRHQTVFWDWPATVTNAEPAPTAPRTRRKPMSTAAEIPQTARPDVLSQKHVLPARIAAEPLSVPPICAAHAPTAPRIQKKPMWTAEVRLQNAPRDVHSIRIAAQTRTALQMSVRVASAPIAQTETWMETRLTSIVEAVSVLRAHLASHAR